MLEIKIKDNLHKKLETLIIHLKDLKLDKKRANSQFKEQMDECQKKIEAIAQTLQSGDKTFLVNGFNQYEIEAFER